MVVTRVTASCCSNCTSTHSRPSSRLKGTKQGRGKVAETGREVEKRMICIYMPLQWEGPDQAVVMHQATGLSKNSPYALFRRTVCHQANNVPCAIPSFSFTVPKTVWGKSGAPRDALRYEIPVSYDHRATPLPHTMEIGFQDGMLQKISAISGAA